MKKSKAGALVKFCGHDGWFAADIIKVGNVNVVRANGPITPDKLIRPADEATHHVMDYPDPGYWGTHIGVLVVPENQVREIKR